MDEKNTRTTCPICGEPIKAMDDGTNNKDMRCHPDCISKQVQKFVRFASEDGLGINGLSEEKLTDLICGGYIYSFRDLLSIPDRYDYCGNIEFYMPSLHERTGWNEASVLSLVESIRKAIEDVDIAHYLSAFSIPLCNLQDFQKLADTWDREELMAKIGYIWYCDDQSDFLHELQPILGDEKAKAFLGWFQDLRNLGEFWNLQGHVYFHGAIRKDCDDGEELVFS